MIVYDLVCSLDHAFEGWFPDAGGFRDQQERGLLECPVCGDRSVARRPSASRINRGVPRPAESATVSPPERLARFVDWVARNFEDVGDRFPEEARRIHHGDAPQRRIRGQASRQEAEALMEEGVPVMPVPLPRSSDLN